MADKKSKKSIKINEKEKQRDFAYYIEIYELKGLPVSPEAAKARVLSVESNRIFPGLTTSFEVYTEDNSNMVRKTEREDGLLFLTTENLPEVQKQRRKKSGDPINNVIAGCICKIIQVIRNPVGFGLRVLVEVVDRAFVEVSDYATRDEYVTARIIYEYNEVSDTSLIEAHKRSLVVLANEFSNISGKINVEGLDVLENSESLELFTDSFASILPTVRAELRKKLLLTVDAVERAVLLEEHLQNESAVDATQRKIAEKVKVSIDKMQKDYYLREQIKAIQEELGERAGSQVEIEKYMAVLSEIKASPDIIAKVKKEIDRLAITHSGSPEGAYIRNYLDTVFELPWGKVSEEKLSIVRAKKILDRDHYGMEKVKERIIEFLAVKELKKRNGEMANKGPIICLLGPPGVGKTSIAKSLAESTGRKYVRMSLGGMHDEAEIRGHRRTYIGAMPGRVIQAMRQAGTDNPLILLDEIDKIDSGVRGDPAAALLEVLDSEQNNTFRDNYLELPYDLSNVLFITTANSADTIPQPLKDRMEIIVLSGYTEEEKTEIAIRHVIPKIMKENSVTRDIISFSRKGVKEIIRHYTRESGVRELERQIGKCCRKAAVIYLENKGQVTVSPENIEMILGKRKYKVTMKSDTNFAGVATGLAWTPFGGDILSIEAQVVAGTGKLELTGQLGDVMQESARIAVAYVRFNRLKLGIEERFDNEKDIHIHVPAGATPKDGPSAGVTMTSAIVSALTGIPVDRNIAMTGEITLHGKVLPVGGIKEKLTAALRGGITKVLVPSENESDVEELNEVIRKQLDIRLVDDVVQVLKEVMPGGIKWD